MTYNVLVTEKAQQACKKLKLETQNSGEILTFENKNAAEEYLQELSSDRFELRIQSKAKNDSRNIDSYVVAIPDYNTRNPVEKTDRGYKFHVSANQRGSIGESLVSGRYGISPGLKQILKDQYGVDEEAYIRISRKSLSDFVDIEDRWFPDVIICCSIPSESETMNELFACEVKTGNASFERNQKEVMSQVAEQIRVLKIRVYLQHLPDKYEMSIDELTPGQNSGE